jgi:hypothetical protein
LLHLGNFLICAHVEGLVFIKEITTRARIVLFSLRRDPEAVYCQNPSSFFRDHLFLVGNVLVPMSFAVMDGAAIASVALRGDTECVKNGIHFG